MLVDNGQLCLYVMCKFLGAGGTVQTPRFLSKRKSTGATGHVLGSFKNLSKNLSLRLDVVNVPASALLLLSASLGTGFPSVS